MPVSCCSSANRSTAPTLADTAPTCESDDEDYAVYEGKQGTWMTRCSCGNQWDGCSQCPDCADYELVFEPRPFWTTQRHRRNMRLFRGVARALVRLKKAMLHAAERVYEPGSAAYLGAMADYKEKRGLLMGKENLPAAKRARA